MQAVLELLTISPSRASSIVWAVLANIVSHNRNNKRQIAIALACSIFVVPCHAQKRFFVKHDTTRLAQNAPLACECSIQCRPAYIVESGHILKPFARLYQLAGLGNLHPGEFLFPAKLDAAPPRFLHSGLSAFNDQAAFKLRQYADHLPHGAACGRLRVDGFRE